MEKQLDIWRLIYRSLTDSTPIMLLYVLQSSGSSPGRQGFFMAINDVGQLQGSIGGGIMEHKLVEMAKDKLRITSLELSVKEQVHNKDAPKNRSGMICSGKQTIFIYSVLPQDIIHIENIIKCLEQNQNGQLVLSPEGLAFSADVPNKNYSYYFKDDDDWLYKEKIGYKNRLYLIGADKCALALSQIFQSLDFYIHLLDDRESQPFLENNCVHQKTVLTDYYTLDTLIPSGNNSYVVIMIMDDRKADILIRQLINREFKYLGFKGSMERIGELFSVYKKEGISEGLLQRIHAPIGLQINSKTLQEIAISIAAEIIKAKNSYS